MAILNNYQFMNGNFKVGFYPQEGNGIVSFYFRYSKKISPSGGETLNYYSFEMRNMNNGEQKEFVLKKFEVDKMEVLHTEKSDVGYIIGVYHEAIISCEKGTIVVKVSFNKAPFKKVLEYREDKKFIRYGLVGIGTYGTPVFFSKITTYPFTIDLSNNTIGKYIKSPVDLPYFPPLPNISSGGNGGGSKPKPKDSNGNKGKNNGSDDNSGDNSDDNDNTNSNGSGSSSIEKKDCPMKGWKGEKPENLTCLMNDTSEKRKIWCKTSFPFIEVDKCTVSF